MSEWVGMIYSGIIFKTVNVNPFDFRMTTNPTHGNFQDILAIAEPRLRPLCESLRRLTAALHPDFVEVVWPGNKIASFGVGPKK